MIPGIQDFYDGMHHHLVHEMEQAVRDSHPPANDSHDSQTNHDTDAHSPDPNVAHPLSHVAESSHHDSAHGHEPPKGWGEQLVDTLVPSILHGVVKGAVHFAAEMATEAVFSEVLLGGPGANHDHSAPLHVGQPSGDGFTHQTTGFTCAVVSQKMILDQYHLIDPHTGQPVSEAQLVYDATVNGWLTENGTSLDNLNKLLEYYGVSSHDGHDWKHLVGDLAAGHQVVIAVNADELWGDHSPFSDLSHLFGNSPNHAIVLKGLKVDDHGKVVVVVNDPGQADGAGVEYSMEHFQSALDSTHMHYVATDHAPPEWSPEPALSHLACSSATLTGSDALDASAITEQSSFTDSLAQMTEAERASFFRSI